MWRKISRCTSDVSNFTCREILVQKRKDWIFQTQKFNILLAKVKSIISVLYLRSKDDENGFKNFNFKFFCYDKKPKQQFGYKKEFLMNESMLFYGIWIRGNKIDTLQLHFCQVLCFDHRKSDSCLLFWADIKQKSIWHFYAAAQQPFGEKNSTKAGR